MKSGSSKISLQASGYQVRKSLDPGGQQCMSKLWRMHHQISCAGAVLERKYEPQWRIFQRRGVEVEERVQVMEADS